MTHKTDAIVRADEDDVRGYLRLDPRDPRTGGLNSVEAQILKWIGTGQPVFTPLGPMLAPHK